MVSKNDIEKLSLEEIRVLYRTPKLFLLPHQLPPEDDDWRYWLMMGGRGGGKSFALMAWLYQQYLDGAKSLGICGADYNSVINDLIPVFCSWFIAEPVKPKFNAQKGVLQLPNGANVYVYTSQTDVRGPNLEALACDELVKWSDQIEEKQVERFQVLDFAVRQGKRPRIAIASTPKPFKWFLDFINEIQNKNELYRITKATTYDNPHLSGHFIKSMEKKYEGTRIGRQEMYADLLLDVPGALWSSALIDKNRIKKEEFQRNLDSLQLFVKRTVVALDPSVSDSNKSDETGIVVAHLCSDDKVYVIHDASGQMSPDDWSKKTIKCYYDYQGDRIVYEKNQGGLLIERALKSYNKNISLKDVWAKKGKLLRAEPVSSLYEQGKVRHVGIFPELELEMTTFDGDSKKKSPGRLDALVYAVTELLLNREYTIRDTSSIGVI